MSTIIDIVSLHVIKGETMSRVPPIFKDRICLACNATYAPTGSKQTRCEDCFKLNRGIGQAPLCLCGCGEYTQWAKKGSRWNIFIDKHEMKYRQREGGIRKGIPSWNKGLTNYPKYICENCNIEFEAKSWKEQRFCNPECFQKWETGKNNPFFINGLYTKDKTYHQVKVNGKKIPEHRIVMSNHINRILLSSEIVHHVDEDKTNNDINNLFLFHCNACHTHHHRSKEPLQYIYKSQHL